MYCQGCGSTTAPTKNVAFSQSVGVVFTRFSQTTSGNLCRACIGRNFWRMTLVTLFFGWWQLTSFFTTLLILPSNVKTYLGALSLPRKASAERQPGRPASAAPATTVSETGPPPK